MKKISRYILRIHAAPFILGTITVLFLFFFQFLLRVIDQLLGKGLSEFVILEFFLVNMAWMLVLAVPMGVLFSTLMSFGSMSAAHEVTIIKASGGSLLRMMLPVAVTGAIITVALFWFNDDILPEANHRAKVLMNDIKKTRPTFSVEAGQFSTELSGYTILSRYVDSTSGLLRGLTIYDNSQRDYTNVISADSGYVKYNNDYTKIILDLSKGEIHQNIPYLTKNYKKIYFDKYKIQIDAKGFIFEESGADVVSRGDREMHISDMQKIVDEADRMAVETKKGIERELANHLNYLQSGSEGKDSSRSINIGINSTAGDTVSIKTLHDSISLRKQNLHQSGSQLGQKSKNPVKPKIIVKIDTLSKNSKIAKKSNKKLRKAADTTARDSLKNLADNKKPADTLSREAAITKAQNKLTFVRSTISANVYQNNDYVIKSRQYQVEIHKKYAIPFACFIFIFVGCPLGIITKGGNFGLSAAISLGFYILYWACLILGEKLADRGFMSPFVSMWIGNFIIGMLGLILTLRVNYERFGFSFIKNLFAKRA